MNTLMHYVAIFYGCKNDNIQMEAILSLRRQLSSGGEKPVQFSAFGPEIHCETSATCKVTVKPFDTYYLRNNRIFCH